MAESNRRSVRRIRYLDEERNYCQRQLRRYQTRCQALEERARRCVEQVKSYENRASALTKQIESLTVPKEESLNQKAGDGNPGGAGPEPDLSSRPMFREPEGPAPVLLPVSAETNWPE